MRYSLPRQLEVAICEVRYPANVVGAVDEFADLKQQVG